MLIVASFSVEPVIACLYRRDQARKLKRGEYKYLEWASNGTLQLQRLAYQGIESGRWSGYTDDIPMTEKDALLGDLTQSYPEVTQDQEQGSGKTHAAADLRLVTVSLADEHSEVAAGSSSSDDGAPTLVTEARGSDPVPGPQSTLGDGATGEGRLDLEHRTARLVSEPGRITLGSDTSPVSPVSPLPTEAEAPALVSRDSTCTINDAPQHRGTSRSDQVINHC